MQRLASLTFLLLGLQIITAQTNDKPSGGEQEEPEGWQNDGVFTLLFNQVAFNNEWTGGGTTNYSGNVSVSYNLNYSKEKWSWDNRVLLDFGMTQNKDEPFQRKTNDRFEVNSIVGLKVKKDSRWSYSWFANFKTQFAKGFEFSENDEGETTRKEITRFLSPGYIQFGPGFLWKTSKKAKINITPATARFTLIDPKYTRIEDYKEGDYFGVKKGESYRFDIGANVSGYFKFKLFENVETEQIINFYSDYLDNPENIDIDYTANFVMKINKTLSANFIFQAIYDDNVVSGFQIREVFGLGINFEV